MWSEFILTGSFTQKPLKQMEIFNYNHGIEIGYESLEGYNFKSRWICNIYNQVSGQFNSWLSNLVNYIRKRISSLNVSVEEKKRLYKINKAKGWTTCGCPIMKSIFRNTIKNRFKLPNLNYINASLNKNICSFEESSVDGFTHWYEVTYPFNNQRGKVYIPFKSHKYVDNKIASLNGAIQLNYTNDKLDKICIISEEDKLFYQPKTEMISMDFGLRNLITLSDGSMYGCNFMDKLVKWDKLVQTLTKQLQRNGIKRLRTNQSYVKLINRVRNSIKNEVNRILNRVFKKYQPETIVVENLDFTFRKLGKQFNRILGNCGLGVIIDKLQSLSDVYSVNIEEVNSAYTSQECSSCGYTDKQNRTSQALFECQACKHKLNADVNASRVIGKRFTNQTDMSLRNLYNFNVTIGHYYTYLSNTFHEYCINNQSIRRSALGQLPHSGSQPLNKLVV